MALTIIVQLPWGDVKAIRAVRNRFVMLDSLSNRVQRIELDEPSLTEYLPSRRRPDLTLTRGVKPIQIR